MLHETIGALLSFYFYFFPFMYDFPTSLTVPCAYIIISIDDREFELSDVSELYINKKIY